MKCQIFLQVVALACVFGANQRDYLIRSQYKEKPYCFRWGALEQARCAPTTKQPATCVVGCKRRRQDVRYNTM